MGSDTCLKMRGGARRNLTSITNDLEKISSVLHKMGPPSLEALIYGVRAGFSLMFQPP